MELLSYDWAVTCRILLASVASQGGESTELFDFYQRLWRQVKSTPFTWKR